MKITYNVKNPQISDLDVGATFQDNDKNVYILTDEIILDSTHVCVNLSSGNIHYFEDSEEITPVNATLVVG